MLGKRQLISAAAAAAASGLAVQRPAHAAVPERPGFFAARDIAEAGLIFGLPIVMNYGAMYEMAIDKSSSQYKAPFNVIKNEASVATYQDTAVVTPNSDTPYSLLWMDLRAEPLVISVPAIDRKRYYSVQLCDASTYNFGYIGTRTTGSDAGDYLVAAPGWNGAVPPGIKAVFRSGSTLSLAIFRTQLFGPDDLDALRQIQTGYRARPLSAYLNQPPPPAAPAIAFPAFTAEKAKKDFFEYLDFMLQFIPPAANEADIRARLASIGIGAGKSFNFADLPVKQKLEVGIGLRQGSSKVDAAVAKAGVIVNGWNMSGLPGDSAHYNGDWLGRAVAAKAGIYGNSPEEATYPFTRQDSGGRKLSGDHSYTITFAADQLPPVNAFWSVTMYDGKTQFLIKNPIDRYLINSPMLDGMAKNADGSVTIHIQAKSPGKGKEANWLPAPGGAIYLVMRLYWPRPEAPSILPMGKGSWKPPAVLRSA